MDLETTHSVMTAIRQKLEAEGEAAEDQAARFSSLADQALEFDREPRTEVRGLSQQCGRVGLVDRKEVGSSSWDRRPPAGKSKQLAPTAAGDRKCPLRPPRSGRLEATFLWPAALSPEFRSSAV